MIKLIKVDRNDQFLGLVDKEKAHKGKGILHRAFSIFIFNDKNEILLQKRSKYKKLWSLYWSNSCCSHPKKGETVLSSAKRRLEEELGLSAELKFLYKFCYKAECKNKGSENELCYVLLGKYNDQEINFDSKEVADIKWVDLEWLEKNIRLDPDIYTPWFKKIIKNKRFLKEIND